MGLLPDMTRTAKPIPQMIMPRREDFIYMNDEMLMSIPEHMIPVVLEMIRLGYVMYISRGCRYLC